MLSKIHSIPQTAPDDLPDGDIDRINGVVTSLVADVMKYLKVQPNVDLFVQSEKTTDSSSMKELTQMLLLNIFNGCAMTYRGCEFQQMTALNGTKSTISGQPSTKYFTGSSYEGIGCASPTEYSDLDTMHVLRNFKVILPRRVDKVSESACKQDNSANPNITGIALGKENEDAAAHSLSDLNDRSQIEVGRHNNDSNRTDESLIFDSHVKILESTKSKFPGYISLVADTVESEVREITKSLNYGPVIRTDETEMLLAHRFEFDDAIAVECNKWPLEASNWGIRTRASEWPDPILIKKCVEIPCYIVRKPHATNLDDQHEWRFSFARQEAMLLRSLTVEKKMIYILTKTIMKTSVLQTNCLTTYHLKTLFLWFLETYPTDHYDSRTLDEKITDFMNVVLKHISDRTFPNYFIPENNMISHVPRDDIEKVKEQVKHILTNFTTVLANIKTAYVFPFSISSIAEHITDDPSMQFRCLLMLRSNFLNIIIKHLFSIHTPNWHIMWMYCRQFTALVKYIGKGKSNGGIPRQVLATIAATQNDLQLSYSVYGNTFIKLVMLFCNYIGQGAPDIVFHSNQLLDSLGKLEVDSLTFSNCMADVTCAISVQHGVTEAEKCCNLWKHVLQPGEPVGTFFMLAIKKLFGVFEGSKTNELFYLIACLAAIVNTMQVPLTSIEVGMATSLRLRWSLEPITLLAGMLKGVSMNGVLKQFVYLWVLNLEEDKQQARVPSDTNKVREQGLDNVKEGNTALYTAMKLCMNTKSNADIDTFRFVVAIIVFQKLTLETPNIDIVKKMLQDLQSSKLHKHASVLEELVSDMASLTKNECVDMNTVFTFAVSYTHECVLSAGFEFVLSVLDELTKPHFNLGILAMIGETLFSQGTITDSMDVIETWITRATGAPVTQNPQLTVQMYGKLGTLYHIQYLAISEDNEVDLMRNKAFVYFRTALKERVEHPAVIVDFLLLIWNENTDEFTKYLEQVFKTDNIYCVSSFTPHSAATLCHMTELHTEVMSREATKISSVVFAHYMAVLKGQKAHTKDTDLQEHVAEMLKVVCLFELVFKDMETSEADNGKEVIVGSNLVLGLAANQLKLSDITLKAFKRVLELDPSCKLASSIVVDKDDVPSVLYTRVTSTN